MPDQKTVNKAKQDKREGKSASTQAGEFVRKEIDDVRKGKHGARSTRQAIAIGLSEARRAGVDLPPPKQGSTSKATRKAAKRDSEAGQKKNPHKPSAKRSRASSQALKREGHAAASKKSLSTHARKAAGKRSSADRSKTAKKAAQTKGAEGRSAAARKAARTRARNRQG